MKKTLIALALFAVAVTLPSKPAAFLGPIHPHIVVTGPFHSFAVTGPFHHGPSKVA